MFDPEQQPNCPRLVAEAASAALALSGSSVVVDQMADSIFKVRDFGTAFSLERKSRTVDTRIMCDNCQRLGCFTNISLPGFRSSATRAMHD